jgi:hypothetical protein
MDKEITKRESLFMVVDGRVEEARHCVVFTAHGLTPPTFLERATAEAYARNLLTEGEKLIWAARFAACYDYATAAYAVLVARVGRVLAQDPTTQQIEDFRQLMIGR